MNETIASHVEHAIYTSQTGKNVVALPRDPQDSVRHYVTSDTGAVPPFTKFLPGEAYQEALSGMVVKCVDIVLYDPDTGRMLIGTRTKNHTLATG